MKYKVNLRKIFALIVSVALVISVFAVLVVSADDDDKMTTQEYYSSQAYLFTQLKDKKIDYPTYSERSKAVTDKYISDNTIIDDIGEHLGNGAKYASDKIGALGQKVGDTIGKYGNAAYDYLSSLSAGLLDGYAVRNQTPTVDLNGSGCLAVLEFNSGGIYRTVLYMYGDYGIVNFYPNDGRELCYQFSIRSNDNPSCYCFKYIYYNNDGSLFRVSEHYVDNHNKYIDFSQLGMPSGFISINYYGDWRNADNTPAETDDIYETITDYDFTQATDKELDELISDLLNEFELQMPDLSSIEGLLNAIYARLGTLDSDDDAPTLSLINSAINTLVTENKESNDKIIEKLENLKLESDNQAILDKLNEIFPAYDYDIDMSRTEELKLLFLTKWAFVEELKTLIGRFMSSYEQKSSLGTMDNVIHVKYNPTNGSFGNVILNHNGAYDIRFDIFEPYLPAIRGLIAAFIYLSYAFNTYRKIPSYIRGGDTE